MLFDGSVHVVMSERDDAGFVLQDVASGRYLAEGLGLVTDRSASLRFASFSAARRFSKRFACYQGMKVVVDTWTSSPPALRSA